MTWPNLSIQRMYFNASNTLATIWNITDNITLPKLIHGSLHNSFTLHRKRNAEGFILNISNRFRSILCLTPVWIAQLLLKANLLRFYFAVFFGRNLHMKRKKATALTVTASTSWHRLKKKLNWCNGHSKSIPVTSNLCWLLEELVFTCNILTKLVGIFIVQWPPDL